MDMRFSEVEEQFRAEARDWLRANVPNPPLPSLDTAEGFAAHKEWEHRLFDAGWAVVSWPKSYGGRDASLIEWLLFEEEYWGADAPKRVGQNGIFLLAPTLFEFGTDEQRERFLPPMACGDVIWAQAWSEPEAGSDLAAIRSTARRVDGGWLLDGQKTWSSRATLADWSFGLFRSDPDAPRHRGLTYFLFPLGAEGVTVRPIRQLDGEAGFAEIFCDGVFVPDSDVLGGINEGWRIAMSTTGSERGLTLRSPGRFLAAADRLISVCQGLDSRLDSTLRADVAQVWIDAQAYRLYTFGTAARVTAGESIGAESSLNKVFWSELDIRLTRTAMRILAERAELTHEASLSVDRGRWLEDYLFALAGPIYAGTNEIQRNLIAERVLGLPKGA
jgi:alkylation response protein AidB-like acyl-CoA dehydrogenase